MSVIKIGIRGAVTSIKSADGQSLGVITAKINSGTAAAAKRLGK